MEQADHPANISFMSANLLGREAGFSISSFGMGSRSVVEAFSPASTYSERIDQLFADIAAMGFRGVDLWTSHCHPEWATSQHIDGLLAASARHDIEIVSMAGSLPDDLEKIEKACQLAEAIRCPMFGVGCKALPAKLPEVEAILARHNVKLGFENHPEEVTPVHVLEKIGHGRCPHIGSTFDTGWWGTHDYPVLDALETLKDHLMLVHLKNVQAPGGHLAASWDEGCLDLKPLVQRLRNIGYSKWISLEYEPLDHDPTDESRAFLKTVQQWWKEAR